MLVWVMGRLAVKAGVFDRESMMVSARAQLRARVRGFRRRQAVAGEISDRDASGLRTQVTSREMIRSGDRGFQQTPSRRRPW